MKRFKTIVLILSLVLMGLVVVNGCKKSEPAAPSPESKATEQLEEMVVATTEQMTSKDAKSLREEFQYGTETSVNEKLLKELLENSKRLVEKIEIALNEL